MTYFKSGDFSNNGSVTYLPEIRNEYLSSYTGAFDLITVHSSKKSAKVKDFHSEKRYHCVSSTGKYTIAVYPDSTADSACKGLRYACVWRKRDESLFAFCL